MLTIDYIDETEQLGDKALAFVSKVLEHAAQ